MSEQRQVFPARRGLAAAVCVVAGVVCLTVWLTGQGDDAMPRASAVEVTTADHDPSAMTSEVATGPRHHVRRSPIRLDIAAIDVSTRLVRLGLQQDGTVEVPADPDRAGWFEPGPVPGAPGSSVVLGHVDSFNGPAVFSRLNELERGDVIHVRRDDGSVIGFSVRRLVVYPNAEFPAQRIYAAPFGRRLNLVTCAGAYDADLGGYQSNLVVYTRRIQRA